MTRSKAFPNKTIGMHKELVEKDELIVSLKHQISSLTWDVESQAKNTVFQVKLVTQEFTDKIRRIQEELDEFNLVLGEETKVNEAIKLQQSNKIKELEMLVHKLK